MRRNALALLPLPFCIALALPAMAQEGERRLDWSLCPIVDAVPAFDTQDDETGADTGAMTPAQRAQLQTNIDSDNIIGTEGETTSFEGNVFLRRGDQLLHTDNLQFDQETGQYKADGSVRYQDSGMRLVADELEGDQDSDSHVMRNVRYQLTQQRGHGQADHIEMQGQQGSLYNSTYTTCAPDAQTWHLQAQRIDVDNGKGVGIARNAKLRIGNVPVLYVPWISFPIDERRRTGLLYPSVRYSGRNGFDWEQPIYLNLAPNYDATLTPRLMTRRGLMLGGQFRYLVPGGRGTLDVQYLHDDKLTRDGLADEIAEGVIEENRRVDNRGSFSFQGNQSINAQWYSRANLHWVSDPRYHEDMSNALDGLTSTALSSTLGAYGRGRYWNAAIEAQQWQLTDYRLRDYNLQYGRLPRATFRWEKPFGYLLSAGIHAEAVRFVHVDDSAQRPGGTRVDIKPWISIPLSGNAWYATPTIAWRHTQYWLDANWQTALNNSETRRRRSTPIATFDAGLFFERQTELRGRSYLHTLEPRLFYLNVPYRDQSDFPLFDTRPMNFSWGQLFRDNRYSGPDRQTDANQLTVALSSRLIRQADGRERFSANIGQIFYFDDSHVTVPGESPVERGRSAWVADANLQLNDDWSMGVSYQWDPKFRRRDLISVRNRYLIGDTGVVNLNYRNRLGLLEQADLSFLYPINQNWSVVGRYYYDIMNRQLLEGIAGVQWESCCVAMRVVGRRYLRNRTGELNNAIQFEFELKGLGSAGPDTADRLRRAILGYYRDDLYLVPPTDSDDLNSLSD